MKGKYVNWLIVLVLLLLVLVSVDITVRLRINDRPCLAIPTRFILEEPECAEKLVQAADVSGVSISSSKAFYSADVQVDTNGGSE